MITELTTSSDLFSKFNALKQERFSGQLLLQDSSEQKWNFHLFLGRIVYTTGGAHSVRRWRRNLLFHCPQIDLNQLNLSDTLSSFPAKNFNVLWEYQLLYSWVEQQKITREQAVQIIGAIVAEVLFDVTQAMQVTYQVETQALSFPQLALLDVAQVIKEVQQVWQTWQEAKIIDYLPNRAPVIRQPEQLQQKTSASIYQVMTKLLDGHRTLRDLAVTMKRDVVEVTCSLLPHIQTGLVELIDIPDLAAPVTPTPTVILPPAATSHGPLVACVDDSPLVCQTLEKILTTAGYRFLAIQDSLRAIATLLTRKPDLIFLDLIMPNTNGYEICTQLRKVSTFRTTPIIILTGNDGIIDRVRAKFVGASGFLSKPVDAETLLTVARQHLNNTSVV